MQTKLQYPEWGGQREILYCTHLLIALGEIREPVLSAHYSHRQEYFTTAAIVISRITVSYLHDLPAGIEYRVRNTQL